MSQYHRENPDAPISHELFYRRTSPEQPLSEGVHVRTDPGSQPVELPKTFEHFKYELRDEYHTFDCAQVVFDLIEQHDQASLENWIVPASLEDVHVGHDPVTGEQQFLVEVKIQPQLPSNGFVLKAEDIHDDLQIDCDDYSGDG